MPQHERYEVSFFAILNPLPFNTYIKRERRKKRGCKILRLSELSGKEIVDVKKAERLGVLGQTDLEIDVNSGQIKALLIPSLKWFGLKRHGDEVRVPWSHIKKIGQDMIIIDMPDEEQ